MLTNKRLPAIFLFLLFIVGLAACTHESGILIGNIPGNKVQKVSPANLTNQFFNYVDSTVLSELTFSRIVEPSPEEGYLLLETNPGNFKIMILVNESRYRKKIDKLKKGKSFRVCGTVSVIPQENQKPDIAIIVD